MSAMSQDGSQDISEITWRLVTTRWKPEYQDLPDGSGGI